MEQVAIGLMQHDGFRRMASADSQENGCAVSAREADRLKIAADTALFLAAGGAIVRYETRIGEPPVATDTWWRAGQLRNPDDIKANEAKRRKAAATADLHHRMAIRPRR